MADMIVFNVNLPVEPVKGDIVKRNLKMFVEGVQVSDQDTDLVVVEVPGLKAPQGSNVLLELRNVDDQGLFSEPSSFSFTAIDTIAPPAPGAFGVTFVGEEFEEEPAPSEPVEEPTPSEPTPSEPVVEEPTPEEPTPSGSPAEENL